jgi:hypothetical protein
VLPRSSTAGSLTPAVISSLALTLCRCHARNGAISYNFEDKGLDGGTYTVEGVSIYELVLIETASVSSID